MTNRRIIKEVTTEAAVVDSLNAEKRKQRTTSRGFAVQSSVKIQDSVDGLEPTETPAEKTAETKEEAKTSLTLEDVQKLINNQLTPIQQTLTQEQENRQKLEVELAAERQAKSELEQKLAVAQQDQKVLEALSTLQGQPVAQVANFNRIVGSKSDKPEGALKDWFDVQSRSDRYEKLTKKGRVFETADNRELNRFVKENRQALIKDLESWAKSNGLLRGSGISKNATTTAGNIMGGFLAALSSLMRTNNREGFIFWQFATTEFDFAKGEGDTIKVPRAAYLPPPATSNDRLLSGSGTYTAIDSGSQPLNTGTINLQLDEWGLGRNSQFPPVAISNFVKSYSLIGLMDILERNLMRDYYAWEDLRIRELWEPTSRVVYNNGNRVTTSAGDVTTGDSGQMTRRFLSALYGYMKELKIPPFRGNKYGIAMNTTALTQLKQDYDRFWSPATPQQLQSLTEYLNPALISPGETDRVSGYAGDFENFMIFETNAYGVGSAGSPGVQNETINGGTQQTHNSFAFGEQTIARGIGTEMQILTDNDLFERSEIAIWHSEEGFAAMDVDPVGYNDTSNVPQQLRVIEVRSTANAI